MSIAGVPNDLFRATPHLAQSLDLNQQDAVVAFKHPGCSAGTIQVAQTEGASGTWVVTVEQSNDNTNWVARTPAQTYSASGVGAEITLTTTFTRVRVSTPQGAEARALVSMSARI